MENLSIGCYDDWLGGWIDQPVFHLIWFLFGKSPLDNCFFPSFHGNFVPCLNLELSFSHTQTVMFPHYPSFLSYR